jgi:ubiquinone/menaquinone biosynthesis C-methylase UbiE
MAEQKKMNFEIFNMAAAKYETLSGGCTRELARHMIDMAPPFDGNSVILDSACGTGVVAQEVLLKSFATGIAPASIICADTAPAMVDMARDICSGMMSTYAAGNIAKVPIVTCDVMPGEELRQSDDYFTHSFTNQGFAFYKDAVKGASEIYRTLKPGGTAVVTTWAEGLGHVRVVQEAQKSYKADAPLFRFPIPDEWFQSSHLEKVLRSGGFQNVEVHERKVWYAMKTTDDITDVLFEMFKNFPVGWTDEENSEFKHYLETAIKDKAVKIERAAPGDVAGVTEELYGFPLVGLVAVAKK